VNLFFARHRQEFSPPDLGKPGARPRVLYIINSGTIGAETTARRLLQQPDWEVTCAVGRDDSLRRRLERAAAGRAVPAKILGWTDRIPELLMTHHALISKAGGATTQEAIAAKCPMIVNQIVPGQEEGNYELLRRHGIGGFASDPEAILNLLHGAFSNGGRIWREWRRQLEELSRPEAARAIARSLLACRPAGHPLETLRIP
jgi:processive 1,2-diacylglycerol beta-glucosyltransferase